MSIPAPAGAPRASDAEWAAAAREFRHQVNDTFADALLLVGRVLGGEPTAVAARATAVDGDGLTLVMTRAGGDEAEVIVAFAEPIDDPQHLAEAGFALVVRAREESGEESTTAAEAEHDAFSACRVLATTVVAVEDLRPHVRSVTFRGGDLATFTPLGPDTFLHLMLPRPGGADVRFDPDFSWEDVAPGDRPVGADVTVRAWRADAQEIDVELVLHGDIGAVSAWAGAVRPGARVAFWGPRDAWSPPADTDAYLLVADDAGLPAVARILEVLAADAPTAPVVVVAEVDDATARPELPPHPAARVVWCHRDGAAPGTTTVLADAVRALTLPGSRPYVWGGAERAAITAVREDVRLARGLPREAVMLTPYWRRAVEG